VGPGIHQLRQKCPESETRISKDKYHGGCTDNNSGTLRRHPERESERVSKVRKQRKVSYEEYREITVSRL
jgi:hypothetical protein